MKLEKEWKEKGCQDYIFKDYVRGLRQEIDSIWFEDTLKEIYIEAYDRGYDSTSEAIDNEV